jgi:hypothetical protein
LLLEEDVIGIGLAVHPGLAERLPKEFLGGVACELAARRVHGDEATFPVHLDNPYGGILVSGAKPSFALADRGLSLL